MSDLRWAYALGCLLHCLSLLLKKWRHLVVNLAQLHLGIIVLPLFVTNTLMNWDFLVCYLKVNLEIRLPKLNSFDFNGSKIFLGIIATWTVICLFFGAVICVFHETLIKQKCQKSSILDIILCNYTNQSRSVKHL